MHRTTPGLLARFRIAAFLLAIVAPFFNDALRAQTRLPEWTLGAAPLLSIGDEGRDETRFAQVNRAWRLSNGAIAVVNGGSREIRVFDPRGVYLHAFGRSGAGPGEFRQIGWSAPAGDTAIVYDGNLRRITTILLRGSPRVLTTSTLTALEDRNGNVAGRVADGRWLVHAVGPPDVNRRGRQRVTGSAGLMAADAAGTVQWLADAPDLALLVHSPDAEAKMVSVDVAAFPTALAIVASGTAIWLGDTGAPELVRIDAVRGTRSTIPLPDAPARLTDDVVDASRVRERRAARDQAARSVVAMKYEASNLPERLPAFASLVPGIDGEVWVQRYATSRNEPTRYVVLSPGGKVMARVTAPPGFRITDVGRAWVVGVQRGEDDVETIGFHALTRR